MERTDIADERAGSSPTPARDRSAETRSPADNAVDLVYLVRHINRALVGEGTMRLIARTWDEQSTALKAIRFARLHR